MIYIKLAFGAILGTLLGALGLTSLFLSGGTPNFGGVQVSVPVAVGGGYMLQSTSTGNWIATSTSPLYITRIVATSTTANVFPYASSTAISTSYASTTSLVISNTGGSGTRCLQVGTDGTVSANASACGTGSGGASDPFTHAQLYNGQTNVSASTTVLWLTGTTKSLAASSSDLTFASTTMITTGSGAVGTPAIQINDAGGLYRGAAGTLSFSNLTSGFSWNGTAVYPNTDIARDLGIDTTNRWRSIYATYASTTGVSTIGSVFAGTTAGGTLSVGSTTPWGLLSVNANGFTTGAPIFVVGSSTATAFLIANNGNVGIGTTTPWTRFTMDRNAGIATTSILVTEYRRNGTSTAMTIDARDGNQQLLQIGASATTITLNASTFLPGQKLILTVCNPAATAGAITWATSNPAGILLWPSDTTPVQTTTANKCDVYSFLDTQATSTLNGSTGMLLGAASLAF